MQTGSPPQTSSLGDYLSDDLDDALTENNPDPHQSGDQEPESDTEQTGKRPRSTSIEEVPDDDSNDPVSVYDPRYVWRQAFPEEARAGEALRPCQTVFEDFREEQKKHGDEPWAPFKSEEDWELARWLMESGASQTKINSFLKLKKIEETKAPYKNSRNFLKFIDSLPRGPKFHCTPILVEGNLLNAKGEKCTEVLELWHRDPVECVAELLGNPAFAEHQQFAPERHYRDENGTNREYNEMWTGNWWWDVQVSNTMDGATIAPMIVASDETHLSNFSGDKKAWPVYLSIGNIDKATRRKPSSRAFILLGYIPVSKLDCFSEDRRSAEGHQLFHDCMKKIMEPVIKAGLEGVEMRCADGYVRRVHVLMGAYIADYPEQCLVCCCKENSCPKCTVDPKLRGSTVDSIYRDPVKTLRTLSEQSTNLKPAAFLNENLRPINPFWKDLPHCDIFGCMTPDLLHQLNKGVFSDHVVKWAVRSVEIDGGQKEIDHRFVAMALHPSLRHFKKGISGISQWTGSEHRSMQKVFLGTLVGITDDRVIRAVRAIEDFAYYAHFETHCDESLAALKQSWQIFHDNKDIFEELGIRTHFNISKLHNIRHYPDSIRSRGTSDGFNSETSERLHIDLAKSGYRASNRRNFTVQMTIWLAHQEAVKRFAAYLEWAVPNYNAAAAVNEDDEEDDGDDEDEKNDPEKDDLEVKVYDDKTPKYVLAKQPPFPKTPVSVIVDDYHCSDFIWYIDEFMLQHGIKPTNPVTFSTTIPVYKQFTMELPLIQESASENCTDVVHATKYSAGSMTNGVKPETPAKTSTVLVRISPQDPKKGPLDGLRAARVRLIFSFPHDIGTFTQPLAFVNWYRPFRDPVPGLGMYQVALSTRQHEVHSEIIPISQIQQTCHFSPNFGARLDLKWDSTTVLDQALTFYVNPYLRHRDFYLFRHLVYLYEKKKEDFAASLANKRARRV
ncbi:hypothetical protein C8J56DRAFT_802318 [Mycena floridula]|nr:hypothetical protein C8J56DRAFT_802318 [Mycena floridula]